MSRPRALLAAAVLLVATLPLPSLAAGDVVEIQLTDGLRFDSADVTVVVNTTVRWRNTGAVAWHTVTADEDGLPAGAPFFDSSGSANETEARQAPPEGFLRPGETFEATFSVPGDHPYFCVPHEGAAMMGIIKVVEHLPEPPASDSTGLLLAVISVGIAAAVAYVIVRRYSR